MKAKVLVCDTPTVTGRVYPSSVVEKAIEEFKTQLPVLGCFGSSKGPLAFDKASHTVNDMWISMIEQGIVYADISILSNTPMGTILLKIPSTDVHFYTVGTGDVDPERKNRISNYHIHRVDAELLDEKAKKRYLEHAFDIATK